MPPVTRSDLHFNFLKNIIIRLDFQGVFEPEMEKILPLVKPYLKSKQFTRYEKKTNKQIEINVVNGTPQLPAPNLIQSQEIHSFVNEDSGYVLDVSSSYICLNISSTKYSPFEEYSVLVSDIANIYKEAIDFFTMKRLGIRKINVCMLEDKTKIKQFFSPAYYGFFDAIDEVNTLASNRRDFFSVNKFKVNLQSNIEQGISNGTPLYKMSLDVDAYVDDSDTIEQVIFNQEELQHMNDLLFEIYIKSLTSEFQSALSGDDEAAFDGLIGVERNE